MLKRFAFSGSQTTVGTVAPISLHALDVLYVARSVQQFLVSSSINVSSKVACSHDALDALSTLKA